jgi:hypothetical protein
MKHLSGAPSLERLLALLANFRLGWKGLPGISFISYRLCMKKKGLFYLTLAQDPLVALNESWKENNTTAFSFLS